MKAELVFDMKLTEQNLQQKSDEEYERLMNKARKTCPIFPSCTVLPINPKFPSCTILLTNAQFPSCNILLTSSKFPPRTILVTQFPSCTNFVIPRKLSPEQFKLQISKALKGAQQLRPVEAFAEKFRMKSS